MPPRSQSTKKPVRMFVSYSHENAVWFGKLRPLLKFRDPGAEVAHVWHDQKLEAGHRWHGEIQLAMRSMDIFVCLVSYEFLASGYIMEVELKEALQRVKKDIEIVPILLYPVNLDNDCPELKTFNPLPAWGKSWRDFEAEGGDHRDAHRPIRDGLWQAIQRVRSRS